MKFRDGLVVFVSGMATMDMLSDVVGQGWGRIVGYLAFGLYLVLCARANWRIVRRSEDVAPRTEPAQE